MRKKNVNNTIIRDCITEALLILMRDTDFSHITISDLTKKAGVGRTSFYRNYTSKEDVLSKKLRLEAKKWWREYKASGKTDYVCGLFEHMVEIAPIATLLYKHNLQYLMMENISSMLGPKEGEDPKQAYLEASLSGSMYGIINEWVARGMKETPEEMGELCKDLDINSQMNNFD